MSREKSFDAAKGFGIYSVVLCHLVTFLGWHNELLLHWITSYYMPIFFLISGYFGYKKDFNPREVVDKRFKELIIPFLIVGLIINLCWSWIYGISFWSHYLTDESKGGFWFLLVLFEFFVIYCLAKYVAKQKDNIVFTILFISYLLFFVLASVLPADICHLLSLNSIWKFLPIFIIGLLLRKYENVIKPWNTLSYALSAIIYISVLFYTSVMPEKTFFNMILWSIGAVFGPVFYLNLFKRLVFLKLLFSFPGRYSLTIYIYHYIFVYILKLNTLNILKFNTNEADALFVNVTLVIVAAIITLLCAYIGFLSRNFKYKIYFGL